MFAVDDLDDTLARLREHGAQLVDEVLGVAVPGCGAGREVGAARFRDPTTGRACEFRGAGQACSVVPRKVSRRTHVTFPLPEPLPILRSLNSARSHLQRCGGRTHSGGSARNRKREQKRRSAGCTPMQRNRTGLNRNRQQLSVFGSNRRQQTDDNRATTRPRTRLGPTLRSEGRPRAAQLPRRGTRQRRATSTR